MNADKPQSQLITLGAHARALTELIGVPAAILALLFAVNQYWQTASAQRQTTKAERIVHLSTVRAFFSTYDAIIPTAIKFTADLTSGHMRAPKDLLAAYQTGERMFYADELKDFRTVRDYFEQLGTYVEKDYIDFDLVFEIVTFPDSFWVNTEELRKVIADNWSKERGPLSDFSSNMRKLYERYQKARAPRASK